MAKLLKLNIHGIRSFGPHEEDSQTISFSSPVSLILGENGCGKTTIIECLKFACTGDLPGGTKSGQGFVNDPKLNSSASTKGRVKLKIVDSKQNIILIYKAVKVEQTSATNQKFSTLDSSLQVKKPNGETYPLSSRCADISTQACAFMGVSKSILNNVIFCHQENSLWPLDEGKKLKEKFDEIFNATRYNTCIESINKRIKTEKQNIKIQKEVLIYKKDKKESVEREKAKLLEKQEKYEMFIREIANYKKDMEPVSDRINEICDLENSFLEFQTKCASKESEKHNVVEQQKSIREKLGKEFEGSDKDLENAIANFDENYKQYEVKIEEQIKAKLNIEKAEQSCSSILQKIQIRLGQLQVEKKQQNKALAERNALIQDVVPDLCSKANLEDNHEAKTLTKSLNIFVNQSKLSLDLLYDNFQQEEKVLQNNIDECLQLTVKFEQKIQSNQDRISDIRKNSRDIKMQLKKLDISDDELKRYDDKILNIEKDLRALSETFDAGATSFKIERNKQEIKKTEQSLDDLEKEYKILQKNFVIENDIDTRRLDILKKENEIDEFKSKNRDKLKQVLNDVPDKNFKALIMKCQQNNKEKVSNLNKLIDIKRKDVTTFEAKIRFQEEKLQALKQELDKSEKKTLMICESKPFNVVCVEVEQRIENLQKSRGQLSSAKIMYEKFLKDFEKEKPCCPVCETNFENNKNIVGRIIKKIESKIHGIPAELKKVEDELKKKQDFFNQLQQIKPVYMRIEEIKNVLMPSIITESHTITEKYEAAEKDLKILNNDITEPQNKIETCNKLIGNASLVDQYITEIQKFKQQISDLQTQLVKINSEKPREQVESDINMLKINIMELRQTCEIDQRNLNQNKSRYQELQDQKHKIIEKRLQLHTTMQGKPQLLNQVRGLTQKEEELEIEIQELRVQLEPLEDKLELAKINLIEAKVKNKEAVDVQQVKYNELEKKVQDIKKLQGSIDIFFQKDIQGEFHSALENFTKSQSDLESLQVKKNEISEEITNLKREQAGRDFEKRKLEDNLDLRNKNKQVLVLTNEINELTKKLGKYNYKTLLNEKNRLQMQYTTLQGNVNEKEGQRNELMSTIEDLKNELNKPENKLAYKIYMHKFYELEITKKTVNDLKLFVDGLEKAIIDYHKEKMDKINKAIQELWRSIYRGNDIDYIKIKTEEGSRTTTKRVYNYKVVQMKNDVELDMRGRCSAGQKVLACLIIRMALAETFSYNCGILALDEPTTNLDRENIISLSETLGRMINNRRCEKNFQLLVITHDEEFIRALSATESINVCHRIKRNHRGNTIITEELIS